MTSMAANITDLMAECDARGILLLPVDDGGLTIDAPSPDALTHELVERIKAGKAAILDILATPELPRLVFGPDGWPVDTIDPADRKAVCGCGSTGYRDIPIHKGQSVRHDCAKCGRFIRFAVWYGEQGMEAQHDRHPHHQNEKRYFGGFVLRRFPPPPCARHT